MPLALTALVLLTLAVPGGMLVLPRVHRAMRLNALESQDPTERRRGLAYVATRAGDDPAVRERVYTLIGDPATPADRMTELVAAVDRAGSWQRDRVPHEAWLRWLTELVTSGEPASQRYVALVLDDLLEHADDPGVAALATALAESHDTETRQALVVAAAQLASVAEAQRTPYERVLATIADGDDPEAARLAWLVLGWLDPTTGYRVNYLEAPPEVGLAILWSTVHTDPRSPLRTELAERLAILPPAEDDALRRLYELETRTQPWNASSEAITTELERLEAVRLHRDPSPEMLAPLFSSDSPTLRDRAVLLAAERFPPEANASLIRELLTDFDDRAKASGAMLAGLTGLERDLLGEKAAKEDVWAVAQVLRLGLWMQSTEAPDVNPGPGGLLTQQGVPRSTVLLAMLHRGDEHRRAAMDYLLLPPNEPATADVADLLGRQRWWPVLRQYLPPEALEAGVTFDVWGSPRTQALQVDVLRAWWLTHRAR